MGSLHFNMKLSIQTLSLLSIYCNYAVSLTNIDSTFRRKSQFPAFAAKRNNLFRPRSISIAFSSSHQFPNRKQALETLSRSSSTEDITDAPDKQAYGGDDNNAVVRSPLRFLGPYPTLPLRFPHLATSSQRARNVTGVSLDFILDTAANTNTINAQAAHELELEKVGEAPGGVGAAGGIMGGDTFMLGDCDIDLSLIPGSKRAEKEEGKNDDNEEQGKEDFVFMQNLTASALPVASPAAAGLLSLAFFHCFEGGVEFVWGDDSLRKSVGENIDTQGDRQDDTNLEQISLSSGNLPSVTFYGSTSKLDLNDLTCIPFDPLPISMLPSVTLCINDVKIPALFDTGSPITVLNAKAAEAAGISTAFPLEDANPETTDSNPMSAERGIGGGWKNPFSKIASKMKSASEMAKATAKGDVLTIAGSGGKPVRIIKSQYPVKVQAMSQQQQKEIGENHIYIGDLPGLAALGGLGGETAPPAAVLGMDFIRNRARVVFRAQQNEIYL